MHFIQERAAHTHDMVRLSGHICPEVDHRAKPADARAPGEHVRCDLTPTFRRDRDAYRRGMITWPRGGGADWVAGNQTDQNYVVPNKPVTTYPPKP